jgi:hypothetical protein
MNSTTINFITEFMQTMLSKRQTSPPRRSARLLSNHLTQVQGAQAVGQEVSQHASPAAFPVASPHTNVAFLSSTRLTRSSSKAVAATFPDAVATMLPNSADANSTFGGLTSIPEVPGTSEMLTASKKNVNVSGDDSVQSNYDWLSVGACVFNSAFHGPSLVSCQVSGCNLLIHHVCQAEWENGGPGQEMGGCNKFCIGHYPAAQLLLTSISKLVQQGLTSRRVGSILPKYSSEEEEMEVKVSV